MFLPTFIEFSLVLSFRKVLYKKHTRQNIYKHCVKNTTMFRIYAIIAAMTLYQVRFLLTFFLFFLYYEILCQRGIICC